MKKIIYASLSVFLLVGSMLFMPLSPVSAASSFEVKDNLGGTWKGEYDIEQKSGGVCTLRLKVKHAYEKSVKKAQVKVEFGTGKTDTRNVSGMKPKDQWEQWTWTSETAFCSLKKVEIRDVEVNK